MDAFTVGIVFVVVLVLSGAGAVMRHRLGKAEGHAEPPSPEHVEALEQLQNLKNDANGWMSRSSRGPSG